MSNSDNSSINIAPSVPAISETHRLLLCLAIKLFSHGHHRNKFPLKDTRGLPDKDTMTDSEIRYYINNYYQTVAASPQILGQQKVHIEMIVAIAAKNLLEETGETQQRAAEWLQSSIYRLTNGPLQ